MKQRSKFLLGYSALVLATASFAGQSVSSSAFAPGTTLPIVMLTTATADHAHTGDRISARTTQLVALANGKMLPSGAQVFGHVVEAEYHPPSRDLYVSPTSALKIAFDAIEVNSRRVPLHVSVRAIAAPAQVWEAQRPDGDADINPTLARVQIGGDRFTPAQPEVENTNGQVTGHRNAQGTFARLLANGECDGTNREVSVGIFSGSACGAYGFDKVHVSGFGQSGHDGYLILTSSRQVPTLWRHSAVLLEVIAPATSHNGE